MSADRDRSGGAGRREVAWRLFAAEYDDATLEHSGGEEERAPNYVVTPTGARVNRLFVVGVLTEVEPVSEEVLRARVVDPTGAFVCYAGQYQPEAVAFLEGAEVPSFVALTGKARTYTPEGSDRVFTSVRPETLAAVDAATRDRWTVQAAVHTLERIRTMAGALERDEGGAALTEALLDAGVDAALAEGIPLAVAHYGTTPAYLAALRAAAIDAVRVVAGERDEVEPLAVEPDEGGTVEVDLADAEPIAVAAGGVGGRDRDAAPEATGAEGTVETAADAAVPSDEPPGTVADEDAGPATAEPATTEAGSGADAVGVAGEEPLGDFDDYGGPSEAAGDAADEAEPADESAEAGFELGEAERERLESTYGTEFNTGAEVDGPGEADIEPEVDRGESDEPLDAGRADPPTEPSEPADEPEPDADGAAPEPSDGEPEAVDLEDAVVAAMRDLDEGEGADRGAVLSAVAETHGVDADAVEDAIQDALMSGLCYEPGEGRLKAI